MFRPLPAEGSISFHFSVSSCAVTWNEAIGGSSALLTCIEMISVGFRDFGFFLSLDTTPFLNEEILYLMPPTRVKLSFFASWSDFPSTLDRKTFLLAITDIRIRLVAEEFLSLMLSWHMNPLLGAGFLIFFPLESIFVGEPIVFSESSENDSTKSLAVSPLYLVPPIVDPLLVFDL